MDVGMGDLTFMTDGQDYCCIWSPTGTNYDSPSARPLALIAVALIKDEEDFEKWQADVTKRWQEACASIFGACAEDIQVEPISKGNAN